MIQPFSHLSRDARDEMAIQTGCWRSGRRCITILIHTVLSGGLNISEPQFNLAS